MKPYLIMICAIHLIGIGTVAGQPSDPRLQCCLLLVEHLQDAGFHLPSYMSTIRSFDNYQHRILNKHQELVISWDSLPGQPDIIPEEAGRSLPLSPDFNLVSRRRNVPGGAEFDNSLFTHALV